MPASVITAIQYQTGPFHPDYHHTFTVEPQGWVDDLTLITGHRHWVRAWTDERGEIGPTLQRHYGIARDLPNGTTDYLACDPNTIEALVRAFD